MRVSTHFENYLLNYDQQYDWANSVAQGVFVLMNKNSIIDLKNRNIT